ncbi:uncharacterized protein LOC143301658 [Babylonia areolata]|uniref:uncharacterized protein LOC143301658 n=1 Tax=Babylonia areolata TaxID=304850 RepID=UPI003FCF2F8A
MDSKQAPPPDYSEAAGTPNQGYVPTAGEQGYGYPPQAGYPAGYSQPSAPGQQQQQQPPPPAGYYNPQPGGYAFQQTVVTNQPVRAMAVTTVPDHMGLAIFTTLCCCWPLGLVAIMRAQESRRAVERGDITAATTYSTEARRYSMWAIAGGCVSIVLIIVIVVVYVTTAASTTYYY